MNAPQGIAIDQANGNLYVTDQGNRRVDVFSADGTFQGAFGWKVNATAPLEELQFCTTATGCQSGSTGGQAGQFAAALGYPAVAPNVAPNAGNVIVANSTNNRVDEFSVTLNGSNEVTGAAFVRGFGWKVNAEAPLEQLQACTTATGCQAGSFGGGLGQFSNIAGNTAPGLGSGRGRCHGSDLCGQHGRRLAAATTAPRLPIATWSSAWRRALLCGVCTGIPRLRQRRLQGEKRGERHRNRSDKWRRIRRAAERRDACRSIEIFRFDSSW